MCCKHPNTLRDWSGIILYSQSSWSRCNDPGWRTAAADQWGTGYVSDGAHSQSDRIRDGLPGVSALCASWPGHTQLPGGQRAAGENWRLWNVKRHLQHWLLPGKSAIVFVNACVKYTTSHLVGIINYLCYFVSIWSPIYRISLRLHLLHQNCSKTVILWISISIKISVL